MTHAAEETTDTDGDERVADATLAARAARLEARVADRRQRAEPTSGRLDRDATTDTDENEGSRGGTRLTRRGTVAVGGLIALLGLGVSSARADPQGQVGTSDDPLTGLYTRKVGAGSTGPLAFDTAGIRALTLGVSGTDGNGDAAGANVVAGYEGNDAGGTVGATISGGGSAGTASVEGSDRPNTNEVTDDYGTVGGGKNNRAGLWATVAGGEQNTASAGNATVAGGMDNAADIYAATVGGGSFNEASGANATVAGGEQNTASGLTGTVGGGSFNEASGENLEGLDVEGSATVGGGEENTAGAPWATVSGGRRNDASGRKGFVGGGSENTAGGADSTVAGGSSNTADDRNAAVGGGGFNTASGEEATVAGGQRNDASGAIATVGGGKENVASGDRATVPGGAGNVADGEYSFAAGREANTNEYDGAVVFGDSSATEVRARGPDEFRTQMPIYTPTLNQTSARSKKTDVEPVDPEGVLAGVESLDVGTWEFTDTDDGRHMGPMAGAFHETFGLGDDDGCIGTVDADGVAFAAIQGLSQRHAVTDERVEDLERDTERRTERIDELAADRERKEKRIAALEAENAALHDRLNAIEARLDDAGRPSPEVADD